FQPADTFKKEMDRVIREIRESERMEGVDRIWLPGEMEYYSIRERQAKGIPVATAVVEGLRKLADELKVADRLE
ncbi:MAG TPA: Ldh family oxidoreductase, partial [Candidatus Sulfotelmatobacter sp.]|nr:Ldh family oxidoreductase [Candidatus Sulfotelmatobacter sp.]